MTSSSRCTRRMGDVGGLVSLLTLRGQGWWQGCRCQDQKQGQKKHRRQPQTQYLSLRQRWNDETELFDANLLKRRCLDVRLGSDKNAPMFLRCTPIITHGYPSHPSRLLPALDLEVCVRYLCSSTVTSLDIHMSIYQLQSLPLVSMNHTTLRSLSSGSEFVPYSINQGQSF